MFAIRRDLRRGKKNGFFQVKEAITNKKTGDVVEYIDGTKYDIVMKGCYLHNNINVSTKIFNGRYPKKRPCAWIVCDSYKIVPRSEKNGSNISFKPRTNPNFLLDGKKIDAQSFDVLVASNNKIYIG